MNTAFSEYATEHHDTGEPVEGGNNRLLQVTGLLLTITCLVMLIWVAYVLSNPETLPIRQVRIEGEFFRLSPDNLKTLVTNKVRGGFFNVNVDTVRNVLLANPWVRDVTVQRVWPDALRVSVLEQVAVARWGETGLLNQAGEFFAPEKVSFPGELPVLNGPAGTEVLLLKRYNDIQGSLQDVGWKIRILTLNDRRAWQFELDNGIRVILGRTDLDLRLKRFLELVPVGLSEKLSQTELVDMRYTNGFAVRWKSDDSGKNLEIGLDDNGKKT